MNNDTANGQLKGVGGWLLFFIVTLTIIRPLVVVVGLIANWVILSDVVDSLPGLIGASVFDSVLVVALAGYGIYAGVKLWTIQPGAVRTAKIFLALTLAYVFGSPLLYAAADLPGVGYDVLMVESVKEIVQALIYFGVWFSYLNVSRRVQATYGAAAAAPAQPTPASSVPAAAAVPASSPAPARVATSPPAATSAKPSGTLKVLPGRFRVLAGLDAVPELRFHAPKDGNGQIEITFGRSSGQPYRHVQLAPKTVSRRQARLVFHDGHYDLTNYAPDESNPTTVNARPLAVNESAPLHDGDVITMGEVKFQFAAS